MVGVRLLPLPQYLIHLSSQFAAPKPNLPILGSYLGSYLVTTQVVGCGSRNAQVGDQAFWFCGESLEHIPALLFCR